MIAIVHSIYSQSVHALARDAGLMDNDAERYCNTVKLITMTYTRYYNSLDMNVQINTFFEPSLIYGAPSEWNKLDGRIRKTE